MSNQITPIKKLEKDLVLHQKKLTSVLPAHMPTEKFMRTLALAAQTNEKLLGCDRNRLIVECQKAAKDGLLVDGRESAIVTYRSNVNGNWVDVPSYQPMISGILKLIKNSGKVARIDAVSVYSNDPFSYNPSRDKLPDHNPDWFGDRGELVGVYAFAVLTNGETAIRILNLADIEKIRKVSKSGNDENGNPEGIWKAWYEEKAQVAAIKRLAKRLPSSADIEQVFDHDNEDYEPVVKDITPEKPIESDMAPPVKPKAEPPISDMEAEIMDRQRQDSIDAEYTEMPQDMPPHHESQAAGVPI